MKDKKGYKNLTEIVFFNQDLSASETTIVEIKDEFGNISTTEIVKAEYRKRVLIFFFENQLKEKEKDVNSNMS